MGQLSQFCKPLFEISALGFCSRPAARSRLLSQRVCCRRYAVGDERDRFTLDVAVRTDVGKSLPFAALDLKSTNAADRGRWTPPPSLRPIKLSKSFRATEI
jgi:hypothetical protein